MNHFNTSALISLEISDVILLSLHYFPPKQSEVIIFIGKKLTETIKFENKT
jgi:hypothetical protein